VFLVRTEIRPSPIQGVGVFAIEPIPKGTIVWAWHSGVDRTVPLSEVDKMSSVAREAFERYAFKPRGSPFWVLAVFGGCFINHSNAPNLASPSSAWDSPSIALRDIGIGEELTEDYQTYNELSTDGLYAT